LEIAATGEWSPCYFSCGIGASGKVSRDVVGAIGNRGYG
jgi:hypothetical protein